MEENLELLYKVKKQITNNEKLIYNPIFMTGVSKEKRENLLFRTFTKDFNQKYKAQRINCEKDNINDIRITTDCLLIIDNIDTLATRKKVDEIINKCVDKNIQVIIFANDFQKEK